MFEKIIDDFFNEYKEKFNKVNEKDKIFINVFFTNLINNNSLENGLNYYLTKMEETLNYFEKRTQHNLTLSIVKHFLLDCSIRYLSLMFHNKDIINDENFIIEDTIDKVPMYKTNVYLIKKMDINNENLNNFIFYFNLFKNTHINYLKIDNNDELIIQNKNYFYKNFSQFLEFSILSYGNFFSKEIEDNLIKDKFNEFIYSNFIDFYTYKKNVYFLNHVVENINIDSEKIIEKLFDEVQLIYFYDLQNYGYVDGLYKMQKINYCINNNNNIDVSNIDNNKSTVKISFYEKEVILSIFNSIKFNKNTLNYLLSKVDDEKKYEFKNLIINHFLLSLFISSGKHFYLKNKDFYEYLIENEKKSVIDFLKKNIELLNGIDTDGDKIDVNNTFIKNIFIYDFFADLCDIDYNLSNSIIYNLSRENIKFKPNGVNNDIANHENKIYYNISNNNNIKLNIGLNNIINNNYFKYYNEIENNDFINRKTYMEFLILNYGSLLFEKNIHFNYSLFEEFEDKNINLYLKSFYLDFFKKYFDFSNDNIVSKGYKIDYKKVDFNYIVFELIVDIIKNKSFFEEKSMVNEESFKEFLESFDSIIKISSKNFPIDEINKTNNYIENQSKYVLIDYIKAYPLTNAILNNKKELIDDIYCVINLLENEFFGKKENKKRSKINL